MANKPVVVVIRAQSGSGVSVSASVVSEANSQSVGESRPGNGYGDENHSHTGPPGKSSFEGAPAARVDVSQPLPSGSNGGSDDADDTDDADNEWSPSASGADEQSQRAATDGDSHHGHSDGHDRHGS